MLCTSKELQPASAAPKVSASGGLRRNEIDAVVRAHEVRQELRGCARPGASERRPPARIAVNRQRLVRGGGEIVVQCAVDSACYDVDRTGDWERGDGRAAGHGLEHHQAEGVREI